jgi:hypothetical protein
MLLVRQQIERGNDTGLSWARVSECYNRRSRETDFDMAIDSNLSSYLSLVLNE